MVRNTTEEPLIPILEVSARLGTTEEVLLARLDGQVRTDWAGRPAIRIGEARQLVEEVERERQAHEEAEAQRRAEARAQEAQRQARYEELLEEELAREAARVMQELRDSNVTVIAMTPPLSPAIRARAAERARQRLNAERK